MLRSLKKLFVAPPPTKASDAYIALVAAARNPFFFESLGVPDTLDGRFELIVLHMFLLQHRFIQASASANGASTDATKYEDFARELAEVFFADMDCSIREFGVADTGVKHRIKAMANAYHGRLQVYAAALGNESHVRTALARNLYGTVAQGDVALLARSTHYMTQAINYFQAIPADTILENQFVWPDPLMLTQPR
jgi:cytochrome b pre-mRNA-processing protein 3